MVREDRRLLEVMKKRQKTMRSGEIGEQKECYKGKYQGEETNGFIGQTKKRTKIKK